MHPTPPPPPAAANLFRVVHEHARTRAAAAAAEGRFNFTAAVLKDNRAKCSRRMAKHLDMRIQKCVKVGKSPSERQVLMKLLISSSTDV